MSLEALLEPCFDPMICDRAVVTSGVAAGRDLLGVFDRKERAVAMGRSKVPSGFSVLLLKTKETEGIRERDLIMVNKKNFAVYSIDDDVFGMTALTLMEVIE